MVRGDVGAVKAATDAGAAAAQRVGELLSVGSETILLMYNESIYETADVISTYVYRRGLINAEYSFGAAVGLFNSVIGLTLVATTNALAKRFSEASLW